MAKQIDIKIKETESELKRLLLKQSSITNRSRIKMLLLIVQKQVIYTQDLVPKLKYCRKSIYTWLQLYKQGGLEQLLASTKGGNNTPVIRQSTKEALQKKLLDSSIEIRSYKELLTWVQENCQSNINYSTLYKHCRVHHKNALKAAKKSYYKKNEQA